MDSCLDGLNARLHPWGSAAALEEGALLLLFVHTYRNRRSGGPSRQLHMGFIYRRDADRGAGGALHQLSHRLQGACDELLGAEPPGATAWWVSSDLEEDLVIQLNNRCQRIADALTPGEPPYGFNLPSDLDWVPGEDGTLRWAHGGLPVGLTCATFVLSVLGRAVVPLDLTVWDPRPDDQRWMEDMSGSLSPNAEPGSPAGQHAEAQQQLIGAAARFRPEEVAVGFALAPPPLAQSDAERYGAVLLERLGVGAPQPVEAP